MCGIAGFFNTSASCSEEELKFEISKMTDGIFHRGPDEGDFWIDQQSGLAIGHRRLAIIDLSKEGSQPMISRGGRYVIVYNGEIYNFLSIRQQLINEGYSFRGTSDTEVLLESISCWGLEQALKKFVGMFAFALWDRKERVLFLARDRLGEKPLYYGYIGKTFLFGSELKALKANRHFQGKINRRALPLYMTYSYVPAPYTIYEGIHKLEPGKILSVRPETGDMKVTSYWSMEKVIKGTKFNGSEEEAASELKKLLFETVKGQMRSDVPLGAFLSGGVDSTAIVSIMQHLHDKPINTFSIGNPKEEYNEAKHAKLIAEYLGTNHTDLYVSPELALSVIPKLSMIFDEPFADVSQIPTILVSKLAREQVTVSLSGDGGDELFAGYNRHLWGGKIDNIGKIPRSCRNILANLLQHTPVSLFEIAIPHKYKPAVLTEKINKLSDFLVGYNSKSLYTSLVSNWKDPNIILNEHILEDFYEDETHHTENLSSTRSIMYQDTTRYLPDDILTKVDRSSMHVSLETRAPFLDHRIVEFAWSLPEGMLIKDRETKWLLRKVLYEFVPKEMIDRPKMGFGIPLNTWLRGPLREWGEMLLDEQRLREQGFFNVQPIRQKWEEHVSGKRDWQYHLWDVLMFQAWLEHHLNSQSYGQV